MVVHNLPYESALTKYFQNWSYFLIKVMKAQGKEVDSYNFQAWFKRKNLVGIANEKWVEHWSGDSKCCPAALEWVREGDTSFPCRSNLSKERIMAQAGPVTVGWVGQWQIRTSVAIDLERNKICSRVERNYELGRKIQCTITGGLPARSTQVLYLSQAAGEALLR